MTLIKWRTSAHFVAKVMVLGSFCVLLGCTTAIAQAENRCDLKKNIRLSGHAYNIKHLALLVSEAVGPLGFEADRQPRPPLNEIQTADKIYTAKEALDLISLQNPNYSWSCENGRILIYPSKGRSEILDVVVPAFKAENLRLEDIFLQLLSVEQVETKINGMGLNISRSINYHGPREFQERKMSVEKNGITLREMLFEIVRNNGLSLWCVGYGKDSAVPQREYLILSAI